MKNLNKNSGFTLLEVIIVVIIVGVLASLALPRFFAMVEYSKAAEALNVVTSLRGAIERCELQHGIANCTHANWNNLGMEDPAGAANAHWSYTISQGGTGIYTITATRTTHDNSASSDGNTITISVNNTTGAYSRTGTGPFSGI